MIFIKLILHHHIQRTTLKASKQNRKLIPKHLPHTNVLYLGARKYHGIIHPYIDIGGFKISKVIHLSAGSKICRKTSLRAKATVLFWFVFETSDQKYFKYKFMVKCQYFSMMLQPQRGTYFPWKLFIFKIFIQGNASYINGLRRTIQLLPDTLN